MKHSVQKKYFAVGVALLCVATGLQALTLGRARGEVLLGRPLELVFPVQAGEGDDEQVQCFDAEVFYGENRVEGARVKVSTQPGEQKQNVAVRLSVSARIDEPVVTVFLRAGCDKKSTRKYVFLPELGSELDASPRQPAVMPRASAPLAAAPAQSTPVVESAAVSTEASKGKHPSKAAEIVQTKPRERSQDSKSGVAVRGTETLPKAGSIGRKSSKARLKLEAAELLSERDPSLTFSDRLSSLPTEDASARDQWASIWRALNATPEERVRQDARLASLENDLQKQLAQTSKDRQSLQDLSARMGQLEAQRYANPLVYGLMFFVVLLAGASLWLWRRARQLADSAPWWKDAVQGAGPEPDEPLAATVVRPAHTPEGDFPPSPVAASPAPAVSAVDVHLDFDLNLATDEAHSARRESLPKSMPKVVDVAAPHRSLERKSAFRGVSHSMHASLRSINMQEMLDVRQQADFFISLGQYDAGIAVLQGSLEENSKANPLVYLDLLKIFHTLQRTADYDRCRAAFNAMFTGYAPECDAFGLPGRHLDAYAEVCEQLVDIWGSPEVVDYIEGFLVRTEDDAADESFDLDAFRDLLMLHGIARSKHSSPESGSVPFMAEKSSAVSTLTEAFAVGASRPIAIANAPKASRAADDLDLNLADPSGNLMDFDPLDLDLKLEDHKPKS